MSQAVFRSYQLPRDWKEQQEPGSQAKVSGVWRGNKVGAVPEPTARGAGGVADWCSEPFSVEPAQRQLPVPDGTWTSTLPTATWTTSTCCPHSFFPLPANLAPGRINCLLPDHFPLSLRLSSAHHTYKAGISFLMLADVRSSPPFFFSPSKGEEPNATHSVILL